ncbi:MAG: hypothetical protein ACFB15_11040 [Cyclobacteriaceae bacterium]
MQDEQLFRDTAQKIIDSPAFGRSETYANLLNFLVESTLGGDIPKETTIAEKIFGDHAFDPSESTLVRVYVFNLRKKITKYYQTQGEQDAWRLAVPKGSYEVVLQKPEEQSEQEGQKSSPETTTATRNDRWILYAALLASLLLSVFLWRTKVETDSSYQVIPESGIWADFLSSSRPYYVVLGDLFIYSEYDKEQEVNRTIRIHNMNSAESFEQMAAAFQDPTRQLSQLSYSFLVRNSAEWIKSLTQIFFSRHKSFSIRYMTKFGSKDLLDNNIVLVGMLKTFGLFNNYFDNSQFDLLPSDVLRYQADSLQAVQTFAPSGDPDSFHTDYGFIAKFPGPNNNTVLMCGGLWDTGASQSLKMLTDPVLLQQLEERLRQEFETIPPYFEVLLEVNGIDRTELTSQILHVNRISESRNLWNVR